MINSINHTPAEDPQRRRGRRLTLRFSAAQMAVTVAVALTALLATNGMAAQAVILGGVIVTTGQLIFGWVMFAPGIAPVGRLYRSLWWAEGLKWAWLIAAVAMTFKMSALPPLGVLIGLLSAQIGFGLGLRWFREEG